MWPLMTCGTGPDSLLSYAKSTTSFRSNLTATGMVPDNWLPKTVKARQPLHEEQCIWNLTRQHVSAHIELSQKAQKR